MMPAGCTRSNGTATVHWRSSMTARRNWYPGTIFPLTSSIPSPITLGEWKVKAIIDGEIVVLGEDGKSDFSAIQNWQRQKDGQLVYNVFDILWYEGRDLTGLPLTERKAILEAVLPADDTSV
jgi:ATP-dependent DNA ligase